MPAFLPSRAESLRELHMTSFIAGGRTRCLVSGELAPCRASQQAADPHPYQLNARNGLCLVCRGSFPSGAHHRRRRS
jgi:hypothetical protein